MSEVTHIKFYELTTNVLAKRYSLYTALELLFN